MKNKIRFVTLYPRCHNPGLMKDVGQIPDTLGRNYDEIDATLASSIVNMADENIKLLTGMKIEKLPFVLKNDFLTGVKYILKNGKKVDWFNFYHGGRKVYYWTKLYKVLNPNGKVYLKLDLSYEGCRKYSESKKENRIFNKTVKAVDIVSVESEAIRNLTKQFCDSDIMLICNGYVDHARFEIKKLQDREKSFITVGRLGTAQKATELLLGAFAKTAASHDWELKLVGPVEDEFKIEIERFFNDNPNLKKRVKFIGPIYNKSKLYDLYNSSRVFVLPSRWEGFPLVGPEALHCGCRMILTDIIPPIKELTNDGRYGIKIRTNDENAIAEGLMEEINRNTNDIEPLEIADYAKRELSWDGICEKLYQKMKETN